MLVSTNLILLSSTILFGCVLGASSEPRGSDLTGPRLDYGDLFSPSAEVRSLQPAGVVDFLSQAIQDSNKHHYYWLVSHSSLLSAAASKMFSGFEGGDAVALNRFMMDMLSPDDENILNKKARMLLDSELYSRYNRLEWFGEMSTRIYKHLMQQLLRHSDKPVNQHHEVLSVWAKKYVDKLTAFKELAGPLGDFFEGSELKGELYQLAYFLNLISFEDSVETLGTHDQQQGYDSKVLVNILGDSLLDGGERLERFYEQFDTAISIIGYLPKDLMKFKGASSMDMAKAFRNIIAGIVIGNDQSTGQYDFVKKIWRAACTLCLTARFQSLYGQARWEEEFAPKIYQAIEVGSAEVFDSLYVKTGEEDTGGHAMVVEVRRTSDKYYRVRQFNSGNGLDNHKQWQGSTPSHVKRFLSFVDMPRLNEKQILSAGYYAVRGADGNALLKKLYGNKHLARQSIYTDPLLFERPQLSGTCTASSKMFYFRSFGLRGRLFEIDFKIALIKQLLNRIDNVQKSKLSRTSLLDSMKAEAAARSAGKQFQGDRIKDKREDLLYDANIKGTDQYLLIFPQMFISLISSTLNEMLESLYWIIDNDRLDVAKPLFEHFLLETEPLFNSDSPYGQELSERVSTLIVDLHRKYFKVILIPSTVHPQITYTPAQGRDAVKVKVEEIRKHCSPPTKDKLPVCFYHIINAIFDFPWAPELAAVTSELSRKYRFGGFTVPDELTYLLLDAMRAVYGNDFPEDDASLRQVAIVKDLFWEGYHPRNKEIDRKWFRMTGCDEYSYEDILNPQKLDDFARCTHFYNGPIRYKPILPYIWKIEKSCIPLDRRMLPVCFFDIIKTLKEYRDAPELRSITIEMKERGEKEHFNFGKVPAPLAFILLDAMRSVYGEKFIKNAKQLMQVAFIAKMPWMDYEGDDKLLVECEKISDMDIMSDWKRVAACRYEKNGAIKFNL